MTLTHESLRPLVGKMVTVTRNDIPGSLTGVLLGRADDVLELRTSLISFEVIPFARVVTVSLAGHVVFDREQVTSGADGSPGTDYIPAWTPFPLCPACGERHFALAGCRGHEGVAGQGPPTPPRYQWSYKGVSFDFYRLCEILGITHHAQAHALKKVIRAGRSVKSLEQDIAEAVACLERWKEMILEDQGS